jgi:cysteine desulfurase
VGVGALLMKAHCDGARLFAGGGHEQGRRAGTQAAALIAAFGAAAQAFPARYAGAGVMALRDRLEAGLRALAPDVVVFGLGAQRVANTSAFAVPGLGNAVAMMGLDLMGISISSGAACSSGKVGRSHVLAAMGVPDALSACALRSSLGWNSTERDIEAFLNGFETVLVRHRRRRGEAA